MKWPSSRLSGRWLRTTRGLVLVLAVSVLVAAGGRAAADSFVQSFNTSGSVQTGSVVALSLTSSSTVEAAPANDTSRIYGVIIDPSQAALTIQRQGQQVYVATSGTYPVIVSNQNGSIKAGDFLSMSSTDGVAAKATGQQPYILGQALQAFDASVGRATVEINPGKNPSLKSSGVPSVLYSISQTIAGKPVSPIHIYSALAIFIAITLLATSLLWVGVKSGMTAIGRNPLSHTSIIRSLAQIIIVALLIFAAGLVGVYLLLRL